MAPSEHEQAEADRPRLCGLKILDAVKRAGVDYVLSVPDLHTSQGLLAPIAADEDLKLIRVCKEDECLGIATGLSYGDKRALILIQHTGFLYAMNAIRALACEQRQPLCLMIGLLGHGGGSAAQSKRIGLRIVEPLLDLLQIPRHLIDTDDDVVRIAPAIEAAYQAPHPIAFLIARRPFVP